MTLESIQAALGLLSFACWFLAWLIYSDEKKYPNPKVGRGNDEKRHQERLSNRKGL
jgi:hypothetical protein